MNGIIPKLSADQLLGLVATKIHEGNEDVAMRVLQEWLTCHGDKPIAYMAWYELGLLFYKNEDYGNAETAFRSALQNDPCLPDAALKLGEAIHAGLEDSKDLRNLAVSESMHGKLH